MKNIIFESLKYSSKKKSSKGYKNIELLGADTVMSSKAPEVVFTSKKRLYRLILLAFTVSLSLCVMLARAFTFQVIRGDEYLALSEKNSIRNFTIQAERGVIYDRNGIVIVRNKPTFSLELTPDLCVDKDPSRKCYEEIDFVQKFVKVDKEDIISQVTLGKQSLLIASSIDKSQSVALEPQFSRYKALSLEITPVRDYVFGESYGHVIGYVGLADTIFPQITGKTGIEKFYNETLSGFPGSKVVQVNSSGTNYELINEYPPLPGRNIKLSLDINLQQKAYQLLEEKIQKKTAKAGVVVAQDPRNGKILALVSYPSFDPNDLTLGLTQKEYDALQNSSLYPFFNRAIAGIYPPGSVFKMFVAAGALEEKIVKSTTTIDDKGSISVAGYTFRNWKLDGHGIVDLIRALQVSNDTYFYTIGGGFGSIRGLGIARLSSWVQKFGFGAATGIDLEGESLGYIPNGKDKNWYLGDTYITSIGQGDVLTTPLQVNNAVTYFANGGKIFKPSLVQEIDGEKPEAPQVIAQNLTSDQNFDLIKLGMKAAVNPGGTGYPLFDFSTRHKGIELAGKTGTAEYIDPNGKPSTHAWFTVFGPYQNANIVLTVFLEGGGSGSDDAAPIAKALLDFWFGTNQNF